MCGLYTRLLGLRNCLARGSGCCTVLSKVEDLQASIRDSIISAPQTLKASPVAFWVSLISLIPNS